MFDALVVGLGPAGSTAAYGLAKAGHKVLALDKESFPRYKSCGGCVSVKAERALPFGISEVVENRIGGVVFHYRSERTLPIDSASPIAASVMRDRFDALLVEKAREAGAEVREGERADSYREEGGYAVVETPKGAYRARFVIGADGANSVVRRAISKRPYSSYHVSLTAEVRDDKAFEHLEGRYLIDFGIVPHGYGWIFPKSNYQSIGIAGMADHVGTGIKDYFKTFVDGQKVLKGLDIGKVQGWTIPVYYGEEQALFKGRALVAGDAGHLVDPFLGEGIYYAVKSGQLAAKAVSRALSENRAELSLYRDMVKSELFEEFEAGLSLEKLIYTYPRIWYRILEMTPSLMHRYFSVIRGEMSCAEFHRELLEKIRKKPWKMLRSWLGPMLRPR